MGGPYRDMGTLWGFYGDPIGMLWGLCRDAIGPQWGTMGTL